MRMRSVVLKQLQSNLSNVTFQGNVEIQSHKTGGP